MISAFLTHSMPKKRTQKKVPTNVMLTDLAREQGFELADLSGASLAQVIERLIRAEYEREMSKRKSPAQPAQ